MKKILIFAFAFLYLNAYSQSKNFIDQNYIEVTGRAEMEVVPNEIYLGIVLNEKDFKGKESLEEKEKSMIKQLIKIGVDVAEDLTVRDMASNFKSYWIKSTDIKTTKVYQLKLSDAKTAGSVFQQLEAIDISNISIERVDHSEIIDLKQQVKIEAIKAARTKAQALVNALGQECGRAIYIQEMHNPVYRSAQGQMSGLNANIMIRGIHEAEEDIIPEIEFEKIKLEYSILVRFELNP